MELYYLSGIVILITGLVIYLRSKSNEKRIENSLRNNRENAKPKYKKKREDFNNKILGAKSGNILDIDSPTIHSMEKVDSLAKWVDSHEYDEPKKVNTLKSFEGKTVTVNPNNFLMPQILLVDDSLTVRTLLGKLLSKNNNYEVILKENGWEALSYLNSNYSTPDLIITDIQMPEMDGFELIDAVRQKQELKNVPIIAISSVFEPEDHMELLELEKIQGFIKKQNPFDEVDLLKQIEYLINNF